MANELNSVDFINATSTTIFTIKHFRFLQLLIGLGPILGIVGGTSTAVQPDGKVQVATTSQVAIILYIVAFAGIIVVLLASITKRSVVPIQERRVPFAVFGALPFIAVRLVYSACVVFSNSYLFDSFTGDGVTRILMATPEEFIVVSIYISLGFLVNKLDDNTKGPIAGREWKDNSIRGRLLNRGHAMGGPETQRLRMDRSPEPLRPPHTYELGTRR